MNSFSGENLNVISEEQKNFYKENGKSRVVEQEREYSKEHLKFQYLLNA